MQDVDEGHLMYLCLGTLTAGCATAPALSIDIGYGWQIHTLRQAVGTKA